MQSETITKQIEVTIELAPVEISVDIWHCKESLNVSMASTSELNTCLRTAAVKLHRLALDEAQGKNHKLRRGKSTLCVIEGQLVMKLKSTLEIYEVTR